MAPRKRKNSAPLFSSDRKGQPSFSLSQPPLSRSINHENTSLSTDKCKHPGDVSVMDKDSNLLCYQCDKFIGSADDKSFTCRLKPSRSDKIPLLLVCFSSEEIATQIMSHARDLRTSQSEYIRSSVFINRDLTKAEAAAAFEIREKRRDKDRIKTHPSASSSTSSSSSSSSVSSVLNSSAQSMDYTDPTGPTGNQASTHSSSDSSAPPLPSVNPSSSGTSVPPSLPVNPSSSCSSSSGKNDARASE